MLRQIERIESKTTPLQEEEVLLLHHSLRLLKALLLLSPYYNLKPQIGNLLDSVKPTAKDTISTQC